MDKADYHMAHCNCHFDYTHEKIMFCPLHINAFELLTACEAAIDWFNDYSEKNPPPVHQVTAQLVKAIWSATSEQQPA